MCPTGQDVHLPAYSTQSIQSMLQGIHPCNSKLKNEPGQQDVIDAEAVAVDVREDVAVVVAVAVALDVPVALPVDVPELDDDPVPVPLDVPVAVIVLDDVPVALPVDVDD